MQRYEQDASDKLFPYELGDYVLYKDVKKLEEENKRQKERGDILEMYIHQKMGKPNLEKALEDLKNAIKGDN